MQRCLSKRDVTKSSLEGFCDDAVEMFALVFGQIYFKFGWQP